jgi:hypothetical protein
MKNISLCQINFKCLLKFANDASQHLWVCQIHKMIIINSKKSLTYRDLTMRPPSNNSCNNYGLKLENI